jgi:hypothetical protein
MKRNIVKKEFKKTDSKGREEIWEWEETPEVRAALAKLHETISQLEAQAPDYGVGK